MSKAPEVPAGRPRTADVTIRSTITGNSVQRLFGAPGAIDYRSHPGQREPDAPGAIFQGMKTKEVPPLQDIKFLKGSIYSYKNRRVITRWLRDVCGAFQLKATTLGLAIQLTDAFIIRRLDTLPVNRCQLAAITSLWISAKFEEMDESLPKLKNIVEVCDGAYTTEDVLCMEEDILDTFKWRIPHTTVMNHLYLMLHIHSTIPPMDEPVPRRPSSSSTDPVDPHIVAVDVVMVDPDTKQRYTQSTAISMHMSFQQAMPLLCAAAKIPCTSSVEVFELMGCDFLVAKRVPLAETPANRGASKSGRLRLFLANSRQSTPIFAERNEVIVLRSINGLLLHCAIDVLGAEVLTHVEFLRLPSHVVALGVLALARCIVGRNVDETKLAITTMLKLFDIAGAQALAAADLLCDKYQEVLVGPREGMLVPVVELPPDTRERLKYVFSKG